MDKGDENDIRLGSLKGLEGGISAIVVFPRPVVITLVEMNYEIMKNINPPIIDERFYKNYLRYYKRELTEYLPQKNAYIF